MFKNIVLQDEFQIDMMFNSIADSTKELYDHVWEIPNDRIFEAGQIIDDAISQLMIAKCKLDGRKQ